MAHGNRPFVTAASGRFQALSKTAVEWSVCLFFTLDSTASYARVVKNLPTASFSITKQQFIELQYVLGQG